MNAKPRVLIIGAGFGGLAVARALKRAPVEVVLVDKTNHHLFQPLLYQVATAALSAIDVAVPTRSILRSQKNARVILDEVTAIDLEKKSVTLGTRALTFDHLVVAAGVTHTYFGNEHWAEHAPGLKTLEDALDIRRRVLLAFEHAELAEDEAERACLQRFVVVGAGPTGVELAGAIAEIAKKTMAQDFRALDPQKTEVILLEGGPRVLPAMHEHSSENAEKQLSALGVTVRTDARVTDVDEDGVSLGDERIDSCTVLWAAGVKASPLGAMLGAETDRAGRVIVGPDLTIAGDDAVSVIGDLASYTDDDGPVPGVAQGALQMGTYVGARIAALAKGRKPTDAPFRYKDKGTMATIGRRKAVADVFGGHLKGILAWWLWLLVHLLFLVGFRNKLVVLFEWTMAYITYNRSARILVSPKPAKALQSPQSEPAKTAVPKLEAHKKT